MVQPRKIQTNKIYNEDCLITMGRMPDEYIDLTVTSPPYDNLRDYNGYTFDFEATAQELYRVTKKGGVVVWVVNDATIKGSETGTSFRQILFYKKIGLILHDTMIWQKESFRFPESNRYNPIFEFMFILSKSKPKTFNPIKDRRNKHAGSIKTSTPEPNKNGEFRRPKRKYVVDSYGNRNNVWTIITTKGQHLYKHPAVFPEQLANDHIISWSNEDDLIYDPFLGSGTTAKMALINNRRFIGSEISEEYCEIAKERIKQIGSNR